MTNISHLNLISLLLILICATFALVPRANYKQFRRAIGICATSSEPSSSESIRRDIEEMKKEAIQRLETLKIQMEELKRENEKRQHEREDQTITAITERTIPPQRQTSQQRPTDATKRKPPSQNDDTSIKRATTVRTTKPWYPSEETPVNRLDLLDNTRWKIAFNIGREPGTWMPRDWGVSGDRLRFEVIVDLTDEPYYEREEFFQGLAGAKILKVVDAFCFPTGTGLDSVGRRAIKIKPEGAYKVVEGQGPMGTDVVRFFVEMEETLAKNDVYCPQGRIYGTCGYFPIRRSKAADVHSLKDEIADELHLLNYQYEALRHENEVDERWFSMDKMKRQKEMTDLKKRIQKLEERQREARLREPERSQLRLSRRGDVGLSKEGGVCCKVHKGLAMEYHILGRMEVGSMEIRDDHDEYKDLVEGIDETLHHPHDRRHNYH